VFATTTTGPLKRLLGNVYCSVRVLDVIGLMKAVGIDRDITSWREGDQTDKKQRSLVAVG
jgi:hypothetical protein